MFLEKSGADHRGLFGRARTPRHLDPGRRPGAWRLRQRRQRVIQRAMHDPGQELGGRGGGVASRVARARARRLVRAGEGERAENKDSGQHVVHSWHAPASRVSL